MSRLSTAVLLVTAASTPTHAVATGVGIDAGRLSVVLQPSEQKQLSDMSVSVAASILERNGVVLLVRR